MTLSPAPTQPRAPGDAPRRFGFDTVFDGERVIAPVKPRRSFTLEEVEAARAEGIIEGRRTVEVQAQAEAAAALSQAVRAIRQAFAALTATAEAHKADSARLALACARRIADAALDRFPEQPVLAALEALSREIESQPRLVVRCTGGGLDRLQGALTEAAEQAGFQGQVVVKADAALPAAAFSFDWGEGRAAFDPQAAAARVAAALDHALAAEALHAPPLLTDAEDAP